MVDRITKKLRNPVNQDLWLTDRFSTSVNHPLFLTLACVTLWYFLTSEISMQLSSSPSSCTLCCLAYSCNHVLNSLLVAWKRRNTNSNVWQGVSNEKWERCTDCSALQDIGRLLRLLVLLYVLCGCCGALRMALPATHVAALRSCLCSLLL